MISLITSEILFIFSGIDLCIQSHVSGNLDEYRGLLRMILWFITSKAANVVSINLIAKQNIIRQDTKIIGIIKCCAIHIDCNKMRGEDMKCDFIWNTFKRVDITI